MLVNRTIFCRDNLEVLRGINSNSIDLIYLDPPFNKKKVFAAPIGSTAEGASFKDIFQREDVKDEWVDIIKEVQSELADFLLAVPNSYNKYYLSYMAIRLLEMKRILKDTGSLYLHCDSTMSHYLKLLLDIIISEKNFRNEIIWCYHGPGSPKMRQFNRKTDSIFWYSKSATWTFNANDIRLPYKDPNQSLRRAMSPIKSFTQKEVETYREKGKIPENWWEMRIAARSKSEYVGYPTQKPLALLERIIKASSNPGEIVLDPFCGCATTCIAAERLGRQWVGIDISEKAFALVKQRLKGEVEGFMFKNNEPIYRTDIPARTDTLRNQFTKTEIKTALYGKQHGNCAGCNMHFDYRHFDIDHIVPKAKGGADNLDNLQLLCGSCNSIKGDRTMEYLKTRLKEL